MCCVCQIKAVWAWLQSSSELKLIYNSPRSHSSTRVVNPGMMYMLGQTESQLWYCIKWKYRNKSEMHKNAEKDEK